MANTMVPGPDPEPLTTRSHATSEAALHEHPTSVCIATDALPPAGATRTIGRSSSNSQGAGSWATTSLVSLRAMVPVRGVAAGLGLMLRVTVASPWPEVGEMPIHPDSLAAVHVHSRAAETETFTCPPLAGTSGTEDAKDVAQRVVLGPVISVTDVPPQAIVIPTTAMASPIRKLHR